MEAPAGPEPAIPSLPNLRDVGGYSTRDGRRVGSGILYRAGALDGLAPADAGAFAALGLRTVYDLRSQFERIEHPDPAFPGVDNVALDMMGLVPGTAPNAIEKAMAEPAAPGGHGADGGVAVFSAHYREFVTFPRARQALGVLFGELADRRRDPALVHCMGGKDRTGWVVAALLTLLGVPAETVMTDYLLTNVRLAAMARSLVDDFLSHGGPPDMAEAILQARPAYLEAALDEMCTVFDGAEGYFMDGLGLDCGTVDALRARFLDGD